MIQAVQTRWAPIHAVGPDVEPVGGIGRKRFEPIVGEHGCDAAGRTSDVRRVAIDLGRDAPRAVIGPPEVRRLERVVEDELCRSLDRAAEQEILPKRATAGVRMDAELGDRSQLAIGTTRAFPFSALAVSSRGTV